MRLANQSPPRFIPLSQLNLDVALTGGAHFAPRGERTQWDGDELTGSRRKTTPATMQRRVRRSAVLDRACLPACLEAAVAAYSVLTRASSTP
jgi:hypothetical protein